MIFHPNTVMKDSLATTDHIWKYGDRYYQLAQVYYNSPTYWWIIAWFNNKPTEAHLKPGEVLRIPLELSEALSMLGL